MLPQDEYSLVDAINAKKITKPVVAWVSGTCATLFKSEVQFGHAGAKSGGQTESAQAKNAALRDAGAIVPNSFEEFEPTIKATFERLVQEGVVTPAADVPAKQLPMDIAAAKKAGKVRARVVLCWLRLDYAVMERRGWTYTFPCKRTHRCHGGVCVVSHVLRSVDLLVVLVDVKCMQKHMHVFWACHAPRCNRFACLPASSAPSLMTEVRSLRTTGWP